MGTSQIERSVDMPKTALRTWLLSLLMLLFLSLLPAQATETVVIDGVTYTVDSYCITDVSGGEEGSTLVVPEMINGTMISTIGEYAFADTVFGHITLPDRVINLGRGAFQNCRSLVSIDLPDQLLIINPDCFMGCSSLKGISFPASIQIFSTYQTFSGCTSLESITLPDIVTSLGYNTFADCSALKSVTLPAGLTDLGRYAFSDCSSLESILIPEGVTTIPELTFAHCTSLKNVKLPSTLQSIGGQAFTACRSLSSLTLPEGLTSISSWAFQASGITELHLPSTLTNLNSLSLNDCYYLKKVTYTVPDDAATLPEYLIDVPGLVITISEKSPLLNTIIEAGVDYIVKETGRPGNEVDDTITTVEEKLAAIVAAVIRPGMSDYQKALTLHNWLIRNATYDYTLTHRTAEHMLLHGTGVCTSYADSYALLLNAVGIPNCMEYGTDHVWNMIQLDGEWYHVDCTWDDPNEGGYENQQFFGLSNLAIETQDNHECFDKPRIATAYKYNYYYRSGKLDDLLSFAESSIANGLTSGYSLFAFTPYYASGISELQAMTSLLIMRDTTYTVNGKTVSISIDFDMANDRYIVTLTDMSVPDMTLPAGLTAIDAEAFAGTPLQVVRLPQGLKTIGSRAFAEGSLWQILIPASVTSIAEDAFAGVEGLIIFGKAGSTAHTYAQAHGYSFVPAE
ncbi:MAG: hypothetical protein E7318_04250 [Clostridiales bacterium]|nr:hypothetical protein [Clostridiales bacterium]